MTSRCKSTRPRNCASTSIAHQGRAVKVSTPPTQRSESPICRRASSSPVRTRSPSTRIRGKALKILRARLLEQAQAEQHAEQAESRRGMVGSGDRSERVRTYNFPQGRVTDHRINLTLYNLEKVLDGYLPALIGALNTHFQAQALQAAG